MQVADYYDDTVISKKDIEKLVNTIKSEISKTNLTQNDGAR